MRFVGLVMASLFLLAGCGGGGGGKKPPGTILSSNKISVDPSREQTTKIGRANLTIQQGSFSGQVTITAIEAVPYPVPLPNFSAKENALKLELPTATNRTIVVDYPMPNGTGTPFAAVVDGDRTVGGIEVVPNKDATRAVINIKPSLLKTGRVWPTITILLGLIAEVASPDGGYGLTRVRGDGKGTSAIFVHGLFQSSEDARPGAIKAGQLGSNSSVYLFRYDYRRPFEEVGTRLAEAISSANFANKSVDIFGYSKGGLATRYALQVRGATMPVRRAILLACPNTGAEYYLEAAYSLFTRLFLNGGVPLPIVSARDETLAELLPDSPQLRNLNGFTHQQNGDVDYYLFAGADDWIVDERSALASGVPIGSMANGRVHYTKLAGFGHMTMDSPEAIAAAYSHITPTASSGLTIEYDRNPIAAEEWDNSWRSNITVVNHANQPVTTRHLLFEEYDKPGNWQGNYWFDAGWPPGVFFPHERVPWEVRLEVGQSTSLPTISFWTDETETPIRDAQPDKQARTSHQILIATGDDGQVYKVESDLTMTYLGQAPDPPHTRKANLSSNGRMPVGRLK